MKQQSVQNFISNYGQAFSLDTLLIEQQYSMRSYETGLYDIRSDGNLRSIINILNDADLSVFKKIEITVPNETQMKNGLEDADWLFMELKEEIRNKTMFIPTEYGKNALENRLNNIAFNGRLYGDLVLTYFAIKEREHTIFICPGSPRPENPLYDPAEKPWFEEQVKEAVATFFFNSNQHVYGRKFDEKIFEISNFVSQPNLDFQRPHYSQFENIDLYFPYRLTDADYGFEKLCNEHPSYTFGVTDPNNSLDKLPFYETIKNRVVKLDPKKHKDYLLTIYANRNTKIYMPADLTKTIHMGPVEILSIFKNKTDKIVFPSDWDDDKISSVWKEARRSLI
ncbi:hypothetical protein EVB81_139 [Rhizobium phage RHph_I46]|uniref:Uncharacterized protein n=1 Tax=Rhizobium phage RHph_I1_9 TaxID=2509729 RepID=A0A7S5UWR3_9CAUD|nr:hypothetical protein PP936_gp138 [Rhizobium phage RHph_I1_9]QIG69708.1 hypothetical protein EVB81_139 [Rhizobium phage RHph_I46]QIG70989.1 hypothetical protein EVB92_139 [Rhizobium phage RHph_I9]QIG73575.1 hypothetical protein EVC04_138 [Rhizobium phage RHph_I1_9]QIG76328.1 hypothetical protein EVC25_139 [Rhizobium phage RHph_I34]